MEVFNRTIRSGSNKNIYDITNLTDEEPVRTHIVNTQGARDLMVAITSDKGCTIIITPIDNLDDNTALGKASNTGTIPDGGDSDRFLYASIASPKAQIVITKTESGDTASFRCIVRGQI